MSHGLCQVCEVAVRARKRDMSPDAVAMLIVLGAMQPSAVGQPMCDRCFDECREFLIEAHSTYGDSAETSPAMRSHAPTTSPLSDVA